MSLLRKENKGGGVMNKLLDSLHKKILKSKFAEEVTEAEIDALVEAKENNCGWIPCSERLPDAEADVLLSLRSLDIYVGFMANTEGMFYVEGEGYVEYENVLAWQPLPTPYQPKGE